MVDVVVGVDVEGSAVSLRLLWPNLAASLLLISDTAPFSGATCSNGFKGAARAPSTLSLAPLAPTFTTRRTTRCSWDCAPLIAKQRTSTRLRVLTVYFMLMIIECFLFVVFFFFFFDLLCTKLDPQMLATNGSWIYL